VAGVDLTEHEVDDIAEVAIVTNFLDPGAVLFAHGGPVETVHGRVVETITQSAPSFVQHLQTHGGTIDFQTGAEVGGFDFAAAGTNAGRLAAF